jgi:arylformamidase
MMNIKYLSHYINSNTPLYGGENAIEITNRSQINDGASSNTKFLKMPNHVGTHIDFPNHFSDDGKVINDYEASYWITENVFVLEYHASAEEILNEKIFADINLAEDTEFIIINTGFSKQRNQKEYWNNNPGLSPELSYYLKDRCPNLKWIGFDFISVSSYQNRQLGREAHKAFLVENEILLIEDMDLQYLNKDKIRRITALPWLIDQVDGVPITIIAEYEEN